MARTGFGVRRPVSRLRGGGALAALLPFLLFLLGFEILPLTEMIWKSLEGDGGITVQTYREIFTNRYYLTAFRNSIQLSLLSSVVGLAVGIVGAYALSRLSQRTRDRVLVFANMTSNFAGVPLAFAYIVLLGTNGIVTLFFKQILHVPLDHWFNLYSWAGLALVYVYFQIPLAILLLYPAYYGLRDEWREGVESLGGGRLAFWLYVGLPMLFPALVGTFSILFANALGAYATAYALTNNTFNLVPLQISSLVAGDVDVDPALASALAVVLGAVMLTCIAVNQWMAARVRRDGA